MTRRGRFVTFEGIDGAGKSTQIAAMVAHLQARGIDVVQTREPGGTPFAEALRGLLLAQPMSPRAETLAMFAARADHLDRVITPALAAGRWVVSDRFTDATYAYQCGGRGLPRSAVASLESWVHPDLQPDLTFLVDLPPEVAAARRVAARAADRFEAESLVFFQRVRDEYLARAAMAERRFCVVDGKADPATLQRELLTRVDELLMRTEAA